MVLLQKYDIFNDITKFKIGDIFKISFPGENFWTNITTITKTTKKFSAKIVNKLMTPYPNKTIKFKVENMLDIYKDKKLTKIKRVTTKKNNKITERVKS